MRKNVEYIGVEDEYIPENERYVDESLLGDDEKTKKAIKRFGIVHMVVMFIPFIMFVLIAFFIITQFNRISNMQLNQANSMFSIMNSSNSFVKVDQYYAQFQGTNDGWTVRHLIDHVVTHNKTENYIVTVVYNDITAITEDELVALKYQIEDSGFVDYELSIDYTQYGANKITIKDITEINNTVEN